MSYENGQSLIELVIAIGIFVVVISSLAFLVFNGYAASYLASEITQATLLAEEGLEATRSIRDNSWVGLGGGDHGLSIDTGGHWVFQGTEEDISGQLGQGAKRVITIEDVDPNNSDPDRKKVISKVFWQFTESKPQEVSLVTYLTNWKKTTEAFICDVVCQWDGYIEGVCRPEPSCPGENELGGLGEYGCTINKLCCCAP